MSVEAAKRFEESVWSGVGLEQEVKAALTEKRTRASQIVKDHARLAILSTAVIQNGSLDALMLAYANLKLVRALVIHFGFRPSYPALLTMYGQILATALIAQRVEDMQLQDVFPPLSASVGSGVMSAIPGLHLLVHALLQGMGSAFLTLRTGYLTKNIFSAERRPLIAGGNANRPIAVQRKNYSASSWPPLPTSPPPCAHSSKPLTSSANQPTTEEE